jgi:hypothetical protein
MLTVVTIGITHQLVRQLDLLHQLARLHLHRLISQKDLRPRPSHHHQRVNQRDLLRRRVHPPRHRPISQEDLRPRPSPQHQTIHPHPDQMQWEHPAPVAEEVPDLVVEEAEDDS